MINRIVEKVPALKKQLPVNRLLLFGSYASGQNTAASDIDLLVVYTGARRDDAFGVVKKTLSLPRLEPHVYTEDEYRKVQQTIESMLKNGSVDILSVASASSPGEVSPKDGCLPEIIL